MKKRNYLLLSAASVLFMASCSKMGPLSADNFTVTPNPLESQGGKVAATVNGTFPEKYMKKKAVVTVTPELRYANGQVAKGQSATFQGEKVMGNDQTISYKVGGRYTMKTSFDYVPEMQKSDMYLTFDARKGKKVYNVPAVKVADGVIATSELYRRTLASENGVIAPDTFQRVNAKKQEANIKFLINQANIRKSELKNNSVKEFIEMLKKINADREGLNIQNVEIQAYASPEGGVKFNDKLAGQRKNQSEKYVKNTLKKTKVDAALDAHYTAQDWEGFQKLVAASNLQDKDVILRVLSMYQDPQEREQQIRNMSAGFQELANGILPELRRSRLIINYETIGRSDEQIKEQYKNDASKLSADELLYSATLDETPAKQEEIYKKTVEAYPNDYRAYNNLAALALAKGDKEAAQQYAAKAAQLGSDTPEAQANLGLVSLINGNVQDAERAISKGANSENVKAALGALNIAKGNYAQAESDFGKTASNTAALAQILNKNYAAAAKTLDKVENPNAMTDYLHAIAAARRGNKFAAASYLKEALQKDASLKEYADNDLELKLLK
ncbi:tetratricopeptide repeat protein [uncultured Prevotella sp.]|uniref:tetratricopeptide repeat protein n=1 Tax=uncultured Prevotella sp. TaxID=159272 RepID=UPI0026106B90|nr:tetratricopeptide repeat protein [uncultured Prevotella sp.]